MAPKNANPPDKPSTAAAPIEKSQPPPGKEKEQIKLGTNDNNVVVIATVVGFAIWFCTKFCNEIRSLFGRVKSIDENGVQFYPPLKDEEPPKGNIPSGRTQPLALTELLPPAPHQRKTGGVKRKTTGSK